MWYLCIGLYGRSEREKALIDMANDQQQDIRESYARMIYDSDFVSYCQLTVDPSKMMGEVGYFIPQFIAKVYIIYYI